MDVAILYSGGKDSTLAIEHAINKGWNIKYLISVKPNRTDCYLFHFATVELTKELAKILKIKHFYEKCDIADPIKEAEIVKNIVKKNKVDALLLGGIGLQLTQLKTLQNALLPLGVEVFATHAGFDHDELIEDMIKRGYKIVISQIATDGLDESWLGKELDLNSFEQIKKLSVKYGFHIGFEGGYADTIVLGGPIFDKSFDILDAEKVMEGKNSGYLKIKKVKLSSKLPLYK